jgi:hypothetical protein
LRSDEPIEYDGEAMRVTNNEALNELIYPHYEPGADA